MNDSKSNPDPRLEPPPPVLDYHKPERGRGILKGPTFSPPGLIINSVAICWAGGCLWNAADVSNSDATVTLGWGIGIALLALWGLKLHASDARSDKNGWKRLRWRLVPILVTGVFILVLADLPLRLCFAYSRPAFLALAARSLKSHSPLPQQRVGLYYALRIDAGPGQVEVITQDCGRGFSGFYYMQNPNSAAPPPSNGVHGVDLGEGWYAFR